MAERMLVTGAGGFVAIIWQNISWPAITGCGAPISKPRNSSRHLPTGSPPPVCAASKPARRWSAASAEFAIWPRTCRALALAPAASSRVTSSHGRRRSPSEASMRIDAGIGDQLAEYGAGIFGRLAADGRGREPIVRAA